MGGEHGVGEAASAFVEFIGANLGDILGERFERTVGTAPRATPYTPMF